MAGEDLVFVALVGNQARDTQATNQLVRSHVMQRHRRRQKAARSLTWEHTVTQPCSSSSISPAKDPEEDTMVHYAASGQWPPPPHYDIRTWLDGRVDPFSTLPAGIANQRSLMLLRRNATLPLRTSVHADPSGRYRAICSKDPAWLSMHLYYGACRFPKSSGELGPEPMDYLQQSIIAVNNSIRSTPNWVDDSTIATVACLANIENLNGKPSTAHVHISGLMKMVQMRGGLSNLGMRGVLRRMVLWSDLLFSLSFQAIPQFPFFDAAAVTNNPFPPLHHFTPPHLRPRYHFRPNPDLAAVTTARHNVVITGLLRALHELSVFVDHYSSSFCPATGDRLQFPWDAAYPDRVYEAEHATLMALHDDDVVALATAVSGECCGCGCLEEEGGGGGGGPGEEQEEEEHERRQRKVAIGQLLLHASLLFIYCVVRESPVSATIMKTLLSRLRAAIVSTSIIPSYAAGSVAACGVPSGGGGLDLPRLATKFPAEVLWVLAVGTCASSGGGGGADHPRSGDDNNDDDLFFVGEARRVLVCAQETGVVRSWEEVEYLLLGLGSGGIGVGIGGGGAIVPALLRRYVALIRELWRPFFL